MEYGAPGQVRPKGDVSAVRTGGDEITVIAYYPSSAADLVLLTSGESTGSFSSRRTAYS